MPVVDRVSENQEEIGINFESEPKKSKKQLTKLINVVEEFVLTRRSYAEFVKQQTNFDVGAGDG